MKEITKMKTWCVTNESSVDLFTCTPPSSALFVRNVCDDVCLGGVVKGVVVWGNQTNTNGYSANGQQQHDDSGNYDRKDKPGLVLMERLCLHRASQ